MPAIRTLVAVWPAMRATACNAKIASNSGRAMRATKMCNPLGPAVELIEQLWEEKKKRPVLKRRARAPKPPAQNSADPLGFCRRARRNLLRSRKPAEEPSHRTPKGSAELGSQAKLVRRCKFFSQHCGWGLPLNQIVSVKVLQAPALGLFSH